MGDVIFERKDQPQAIVKFDAGAGSGTALFSRYFVEDMDGDYTTDTFLPHGAKVSMLIGHKDSEIPVGSGRIRSTSSAAYYDFELADTPRGRELGQWFRHDFSDGQPQSQFSYAFKVLDGGSSYEFINGKRLRVLHGRDDGSAGAWVREVSYVLTGSGISTQLTDMKMAEQYRLQQLFAKFDRQLAAEHAKEQAEIRAIFQRCVEKGHLP